MKKTDAWMPLFIGDYVADTMHLTTLEHGAYLLLLMHHWRTGPLPDDDRQLAAIAKISMREWKKSVGSTVRNFFVSQNGSLIQKRLMEERKKSNDISAERSRIGKIAAEIKKQKRSKSQPIGEPDVQQTTQQTTQQTATPSPSPLVSKEDPPSLREVPPRKVGCRLPEGWVPSEAEREFAAAMGLSPSDVADRFRDFWHAKPGQGGVKLDWTATWRNWCREDARRRPSAPEDPMAKLVRVMGLDQPKTIDHPEQEFLI